MTSKQVNSAREQWPWARLPRFWMRHWRTQALFVEWTDGYGTGYRIDQDISSLERSEEDVLPTRRRSDFCWCEDPRPCKAERPAEGGQPVLAEGEATGHAHVASGEGAALYEANNELLLSAPNGAVVVHEEHSPIEIVSGDYTIRRVREYDHFAEEAKKLRRVFD